MTYIPRREITSLIPNKFEAIRVLALECRRLNDEIRAREDGEVEGKLTSLAVQQLLEGKVTYYDAKERREQERSEAMLSAAEGLLDIAEPMLEPDFEGPMDEEAAEEAPADDAEVDEAPAGEAPAEEAPATETPAEEASADEAPAEEAPAEEPAPAEASAEEPAPEGPVDEDASDDEETQKEGSGA